MSNNAGNIAVGLVLNGADAFIGRVNRSSQSLDKLGKSTKTAVRYQDTWLHQMRDAAIILGLARSAVENLNLIFTGLPRAILAQNAQLERSQVLIAGMDTGAESYADAMERARDTVTEIINMSSTSPFSIQAIADGMAKLKAAGIEDTEQAIKSMVDASAKAGTNSEGFKRLSVAIQQMAGKGVISMEELRQQAGEAIPTVMKLMSSATGMHMSEMVKKISTGSVEAKSSLRELFNEMAFTSMGAAENMAGTLDGLKNRIANDFTILSQKVGESGFNDTIKNLATELDQILISPEAMASAEKFGEILSSIANLTFQAGSSFVSHIKEITAALLGLVAVSTVNKLKAGLTTAFDQASMSAAKAQGRIDRLMARTDRAIASSRQAIEANTRVAYQASMNFAKQTNASLDAQKTYFGTYLNELNRSHEQHIAKATALQNKYNSTSRSIVKAGKNMFNAIGGWTTVVTVGITAAIYALDEFILKQRRAAAAIMKSSGAGATAEQLTSAEKRLGEIEAEIAKKQRELNNGSYENARGEYRAISETDKAALADEIDNLIKTKNKLDKDIQSGIQFMRSTSMDLGSSQASYMLREQFAEISKTYTSEIEAIKKELETQNLSNDEYTKQFNARQLEQRQIAVAALIDIENKKVAEWKAANDEIRNSEGELTKQQIQEIAHREGLIKGLTEYRLDMQKKIEKNEIKSLQMNSTQQTSEESLLSKLKKSEALHVHRLERIKQEIDYGEHRIRLEEDLASGKLKVSDADRQALRVQADRTDAAIHAYKVEQDGMKELEQANKRLQNLTLSFAKKLGTSQGKSLNEFMEWKTASEQNAEAIKEMRSQLEKATSGNLSSDQQAALMKLSNMAKEIDLNNIIIQQREYQEDIMLDLGTEMSRYLYETNKTKNGLKQVKSVLEKKLSTQKEGTEEWRRTKEAIDQIVLSLEMAGREADAINPKNDAWFNLSRSITDMSNQVDDELAGAFDGVFDAISTSIVDTGASFSDMINDIASDLASFMIKMSMMQGMQAAFPSFFADGGIMSAQGSMPLKMYSNGGIADSPQVAVFGEGRMNEAYVPLPDGRTIPVTMKGGEGGAPVVNVINQTGMQAEAEHSYRFDGEKYITDVVLKAASRPGKFRDALNRK